MNNTNDVSILIVDDHADSLFALQYRVSVLFKEVHYSKVNIKTVSSEKEMFLALDENIFHVVLLDRDLGKDTFGQKIDGVELIPKILEVSPRSKILMVTASSDVDAAVKAMQLGAVGYLTKNPSETNQAYVDQQILGALKSAQVEMGLFTKVSSPQIDVGTYVCKSKAMRELDIKLQTLASINTSVLFLGESGLGKTHAAKRLHLLSKKAFNQVDRPFINVNINAIPKTMLEAELFGSEKGSFTSSNERKQGFFEAAAGGDLFLDEIGDAPLELQGALLKVIEEKHFRRIGGTSDIKMTARVIFATNKDLSEKVKQKEFRQDLYARLSIFQIEMPNLQKRKEDIPYICQMITDEFKSVYKQDFSYSDFPVQLKDHFVNDYIPFNIRGLKNELERLIVYCPLKPNGKRDYSMWRNIMMQVEGQEKISQKQFTPIEQVIRDLALRVASQERIGLNETLDLLERNIIEEVSKVTPVNKKQADILKIPGSTLHVKKAKIFGPKNAENV